MKRTVILAALLAIGGLAATPAFACDACGQLQQLTCKAHGLLNCTACQPMTVALPVVAPCNECGMTLCDHVRTTWEHTKAAVHGAAMTVGHAARCTVEGVGSAAAAGVSLLACKIHRIHAGLSELVAPVHCALCAPMPTLGCSGCFPTVAPGCAAGAPAPEAPAPAPAPAPQPEVEKPAVPAPQPANQTGMLILSPVAGR